MNRHNWKEIHETEYCPAFFRDALTDCLSFFIRISAIYRKAIRMILPGKPTRFIDLCSGRGLYAECFQIFLRRHAPGIRCTLLLTDRFPHRTGFSSEAMDISYHPERMDAADAIREPFAVINADDFYGAEAYKTIGDYLSQLGESRNRYCMVAYDLDKTLSDNGTVSRGVCGVDAAGNLTSMVERTQIERMPDGRIVFHDGGADEVLAEDTPVSMNLFGFTPDFFTYSREYFKTWLARNKENLKAEFYIPTMVNKLVGEGTASLRVLRSAAQWHGVTYKEDKPALVASIEKMIAEGKYPRNLWA